MAYMVKLTAFSSGAPAPVWMREPSWWRTRELQKDARFKERYSDGYVDYEALLTAAEAWELNKKFAERASEWEQKYVEDLRQLWTARSGDFDYVFVQVLEWESGL